MARNGYVNLFFADETPTGQFLIRINFDYLSEKIYTNESYSILEARVAGMDMDDWLRYCRDYAGATLVGKNSRYPVAYFPTIEVAKFVAMKLNDNYNMFFIHSGDSIN